MNQIEEMEARNKEVRSDLAFVDHDYQQLCDTCGDITKSIEQDIPALLAVVKAAYVHAYAEEHSSDVWERSDKLSLMIEALAPLLQEEE